jgi:hypothetical protein
LSGHFDSRQYQLDPNGRGIVSHSWQPARGWWVF